MKRVTGMITKCVEHMNGILEYVVTLNIYILLRHMLVNMTKSLLIFSYTLYVANNILV